MEPLQPVCAMCGRALSDHDKQVRFELPDPVLSSELKLNTPGTWLSHADAYTSVMMQVPGIAPFVRALLPVHLDGGYSVTFGVWVAISPDDLQSTFKVWLDDEYANLILNGVLANDVPPWKLLGAPVELRVRDIDHTPYCVSSTDELLETVLSTVWPHEDVLAALPD
jgi:hypothetical protein